MILVSMYTANLAAFLTLERSEIGIVSMTDLLDQEEFKWGLITGRELLHKVMVRSVISNNNYIIISNINNITVFSKLSSAKLF